MTIFSKNLGGAMAPLPPLATPMETTLTGLLNTAVCTNRGKSACILGPKMRALENFMAYRISSIQLRLSKTFMQP